MSEPAIGTEPMGTESTGLPLQQTLRRLFRRTEFGLLLAIVVVIVLTALLDSGHNYWDHPAVSAINILRQTAFLGVFSLGAAVVIIAGGIDLSSGSVIAFSGSACAILLTLLAPEEMKESKNLSAGVITVAVLGTLVIGMLIGSFHAWLITVIGLPPFVATLATLVGLRSLGRVLVESVSKTVWRSAKTQIDISDPTFRSLTTHVWIPVAIFLVLAAAVWLLMSKTVIGRRLHAMGGNEQAARLSGINTDSLKWLAYCISAVLASVAGILYVSDTTTANPQNLGRGYELNAIAAAVVGGCSLQGGVGTITGTVLGVLFLRTVIDGVAKIIKTNAEIYEGLIVGGVVVVAVALTQLRLARTQNKRFLPGALGWVTILNLAILAGAGVMVMSPTTSMAPTVLGAVVAGAVFVLLIVARYAEDRREKIKA
jgi:ribose/xylose/arabinose/galactoside ABC-type transport system permease subunit